MSTRTDGLSEQLRHLRVADWKPVAQLRTTTTSVPRAAHPVIDIHNHLGRWLTATGDIPFASRPWAISDPGALVGLMDRCNLQLIVNLDGMWGAEVTTNVARYDEAYPGRFVTFCQLDWRLLATGDPVASLRRSLKDSVDRGARGLKVWKDLGLTVRDASGSLVMPDDPRVIDILGYAGELGLPVVIHSADPLAFFEPLDERNERVDELLDRPDWWFGDRTAYPAFDHVYAAHRALVSACPGTTFIGAHVGCLAEDLDRVGAMLDACPNYLVDIAARLGEIGRQPRRFAAFVEQHPARVCFGTDIPPTPELSEAYFRFLETTDEGFAYEPGADVPPQGRWSISGAGLTDAHLRAVYRDNAAAVLGLAG